MVFTTVISHFFNEEFLLPYWLEHHTKLFDHGIMINYQSTDRSVDIIKEIAPTWEIRPTRHSMFDARSVDREVEDIEETISGWKMALNTTEFLISHDLHTYLDGFEQEHPQLVGFRVAGVWVIDTPGEYDTPLNNQPLFFQRHHGWFEKRNGSRHRLIHKAPRGCYRGGRHGSTLPNHTWRPDIFCLWFGWSPYPQVRARKLQIQTKIPPTHIGTRQGRQHQKTSEEMDQAFWLYSKQAKDLFANVRYKTELELVRQHLYD